MKDKLLVLKSEIVRDLQRVENILARFDVAYSRFQSSGEYATLVESAYYVSQLYSGIETILKNVARHFENNLEPESWHKSLLDRMSLCIEGIRPALISEESSHNLNELRAFRHFFNHAYDVNIESAKFAIVARNVIQLKGLFPKDIQEFLVFLDRLLEAFSVD